jgi:hypothetical protein
MSKKNLALFCLGSYRALSKFLLLKTLITTLQVLIIVWTSVFSIGVRTSTLTTMLQVLIMLGVSVLATGVKSPGGQGFVIFAL